MLESVLSGASRLDSKSAVATLDQIQRLDDVQKQAGYSQDADSPWQTTQKQINTLLDKAFGEAGTNPDALLGVSEAAAREGQLDLAIQAAELAVESAPSASAQLDLAKVLNSKGFWSKAEEQKDLFARAERAARASVAASRSPTGEMQYVLGDILENEGSYTDAESHLRQALAFGQKTSDKDIQASTLRDLILCAYNSKKETDGQRWFDALVSLGEAKFYDWNGQAERLATASKFKDSGDAYVAGANSDGPYTYWCSAATEYMLASSEEDLVLSSARKCIELGISQDGSESHLADAHEYIGEILNERGVYSEGLSHSKEATVLAPKDPFGFDGMAIALIGLHRPQEAIVAAQQAIVLSDGKYASMHFHLGSAYFSSENWESARESFQKAAELDLHDPSSAYNVALCFQRQGNFLEAAHWYEEYLARAPNASDRAEILNEIRVFRENH